MRGEGGGVEFLLEYEEVLDVEFSSMLGVGSDELVKLSDPRPQSSRFRVRLIKC